MAEPGWQPPASAKSSRLTMAALLWAVTNECPCEACQKLREAAKAMQSELG